MHTQTWNLKRRSGIDDLIEHCGKRCAPSCVAVDEATRRKYVALGSAELWELVLLHSRVDPDFLGFQGYLSLSGRFRLMRVLEKLPWSPPWELTIEDRLCSNVDRALKAAVAGELHCKFSERLPRASTIVGIEDFHAWSSRTALPVIEGPWPERAHFDVPTVGVSVCLPHLTQLLQRGQEVAWEVAKSSNGEWPTNADVAARARCSGFSKNKADAVATLLRPDWLPRGRRRRHSAS